jgi:hypothetical protein
MDDALIFGADARPGIGDLPPDIDGEAKGKDDREKQIDPPAQGKLLPHVVCPDDRLSLIVCPQSSLVRERSQLCLRAKSASVPHRASVDRPKRQRSNQREH